MSPVRLRRRARSAGGLGNLKNGTISEISAVNDSTFGASLSLKAFGATKVHIGAREWNLLGADDGSFMSLYNATSQSVSAIRLDADTTNAGGPALIRMANPAGEVTVRIESSESGTDGGRIALFQAGDEKETLELDSQESGGGIGLYHLDGGFRARLLGRDVLPTDRRTLTPWGVEFDRTGGWDYMFTIADSDVGDDAAAIYHMDPSLRMRPLGSVVHLSQRMYRDLAYSTTGFFRRDIYVTDVRNKSVLLVKPDGSTSTIASGFNMVESLTISEDGNEMFVSDLDAVYRIRREPLPPEPTARMQFVSLSVGVGVDGLTSSLVNVGQPVISAASDGVTFLQAGIMPSLVGGILPPVPGDFDGNRRIDLNDYSGFEDCLAGPDGDVGEQCDIGDFDGDGDIDLDDVDAFMRRFNGPGS